MADTFTCTKCGGTFPKAWSDEEAEAEFVKLYGRPTTEADRKSVICENCQNEFQEWLAAQGIKPGDLAP